MAGFTSDGIHSMTEVLHEMGSRLTRLSKVKTDWRLPQLVAESWRHRNGADGISHDDGGAL